jgi:hypothetical protein
MSVQLPDRALRRLVAELSVRDESDVQAILAELEPDQRRRVENLLALCRGDEPIGERPKAEPPSVSTRFSPWLALRLAGDASGQPRFQMTDHARRTLREAADALSPTDDTVIELQYASRAARPGWWSRVRDQLLRSRISI